MKLDIIYSPVAATLEKVEDRLLGIAISENDAVSEAIGGTLRAGGKRLRPALLVTAAGACGYSEERSVDLAVAVELVHTVSLIHDDVLDEAGTRRGMPTVNARWGNRVAVLAGDYLFARVAELLSGDGDAEIMRSVAAAAGRMVTGEMMQTLSRNDVEVSEEHYLSMIAQKTGSLISCACRVGGMLGESGNGEAELLGDYGLSLGMAFQITDDLLDLTGAGEVMGKEVGNDIREGHLTLPYIHALRNASEADRRWMWSAIRSGDIDNGVFERLREAVTRYEGVEYSLGKAVAYSRECKERLKGLAVSDYRESLSLMADYVVERAC